MTTKHSRPDVLWAQAIRIAGTLKAAERGDKFDVAFSERIVEARTRGFFKVGIVMDDKTITIDIPWDMIRDTTGEVLTEYIFNLMREPE